MEFISSPAAEKTQSLPRPVAPIRKPLAQQNQPKAEENPQQQGWNPTATTSTAGLESTATTSATTGLNQQQQPQQQRLESTATTSAAGLESTATTSTTRTESTFTNRSTNDSIGVLSGLWDWIGPILEILPDMWFCRDTVNFPTR